MKKLIKYLMLLTVLTILFVKTADAQAVYITKTGSKYHDETCQYLSHSKYPIALIDAKERGYEPCKVCKPTTTVTRKEIEIEKSKIIEPPRIEKNVVSKQCSVRAKTTGNRCRRMTKNVSGKCWQHE
ncbi:hypothetical protein JMN32_07245 [Fulvivirga sp. 29W222]|uniref:Ada DNA repair metal-binding domain-containing protein n=1 Tax=Fulvivirga marina TaxID=2494733 RepID=A0A937G073_9BACT|nr:hypothetical protein [Fulvivirga marina]MBL6446096.1 hypothetical protein [Fulvivirga marina]